MSWLYAPLIESEDGSKRTSISVESDLEAPVIATPAIDEDSLYIRTETGLMAFR